VRRGPLATPFPGRVDQQYQANPLHIYDDLRPAPYRDSAAPETATGAVRALDLKLPPTKAPTGRLTAKRPSSSTRSFVRF
jgi:hypothetical protein